MSALGTATDVAVERSRAEPAGVHIRDNAKSPVERLVWTMLCGEQCLAPDDGELSPEGFDFYLEQHGAKASCKACLRERALRFGSASSGGGT